MSVLHTLTPYNCYFLAWTSVSKQLEIAIKRILDKDVVLWARPDACDYWATSSISYNFSIEDLNSLLDSTDASEDIRLDAIPFDSTQTKCLSMDLSRLLLSQTIQAVWTREIPADDGLWIIDVKEQEVSNE